MGRLYARRFEGARGIDHLFILNVVKSGTGHPEHYNTVEVSRVHCHVGKS
ncbi:MAG: hypothetical protein IH953_05030 [Chloroflexi bacterium]|nr:hypothetical protein [Chloroflexota bacterium]